ncbi:inositol polyphosphate 1-phosphatase [Ursus maritimus]|uniref:Inositol polyphosphate 1-phosphatase n=1 Tax=Ursus maritimus TaxID=29073 RepID=A0A384BSD4_URSMA|nr:inositol polyphosphate 1-phosphatase [Ursus maritimus]XP_040498734.1 inositol polyphosphate 1-phosphatase [Ursus maritimus]XP_040498738.1 inositol polyphosphate 1-phosphatase [Ursus maritimus]
MSDILRELLRVSEKAANIARACRQQEALFQLLIEEKKDGEKNKKFAVDFKTLADVLVQEVIKQNMENKFPGLGKKILGEESNEFTNDLGEKITLRLCPTEEETVELLSKVLSGNKSASGALAKVVHQDVTFTDPTLDSVEINIPQDILGIWVDPIDSTYQYIKGSADIKSNQGIFPSGLQCVTILIGVYDLHTGVPLMGVINQPFVSQDLNTLRWKGQCYWGLSYLGTNIHSLQLPASKRKSCDTRSRSRVPEDRSAEAECSHRFSAVISTSEKDAIKAALSRVCGERIFPAAGAGYKSLCVVQGLADIYIFSEDTTFKWDSCAAHAILRAMGGGMIDLRQCLQRSSETGLDLPQLVYHVENEGAVGVDRWANKGGLIAYRSRKQLETFLSLLIPNLAPVGAQT